MADHSLTLTISRDAALCPICLEIPQGNIFQCKNGHMICSVCVKKVKKCGQCRVYLGRNPMRNRAVETMLDDAKFNCSNKRCSETLKRKDLQSHKNFCDHRAVIICPRLGYRCGQNVDCGTDFCKHLMDVHRVKDCTKRTAVWKNFLSSYVSIGRLQTWTYMLTSDGENFLTNVQLSCKPESNEVFSFSVIYLGNNLLNAFEYRAFVRFSVVYESVKTPVKLWSGFPIYFKCLEGRSRIMPCVSFPVNLLKGSVSMESKTNDPADNEKENDFDLTLEIHVLKSSQCPPRQPGKYLKLVPVASASGLPAEPDSNPIDAK